MEKTILIIDDDLKEYEELKTWLTKCGYPVLPKDFSEMEAMTRAIDPVCEGNGVIDYLNKQIKRHYEDIGLILCDIVFGNLEDGVGNLWGGDIIKNIRQLKVGDIPNWASLVPIIAITQYADKSSENLGIGVTSNGADFVTSKPKTRTEKRLLRDIIKTQVNKFNIYVSMNKKNKKKVFIVHGHSTEKKLEVSVVLKDLGLEPIILNEEANFGKTLIEKFESNSCDVGFAVILLTADDLGRLKEDTTEKDNKSRARQNVIFEMGYFMSQLSRSHVFILCEDKVEKPSDIDGIVYNEFKNDWKIKLVQELQECGYEVDANDLFKKKQKVE